MKLSEIRGDRVFDVMADIMEPLYNIASDEDAGMLFKREACPEGMEPREFALTKIKSGIPSLMRSHKADLVAIMATINDEDPKTYEENLTIGRLLKDLTDILTDRDLLSFLS